MDSWRVAVQGPGWNIKVVQLMPPQRSMRRGCDVIMLRYWLEGERRLRGTKHRAETKTMSVQIDLSKYGPYLLNYQPWSLYLFLDAALVGFY